MTWQAPWTWLGLAVVALPVMIHLLGRGTARRQRFPTLRFFGAARPLPTRYTRLHDRLLLAVRAAILVAAVAALARPLFFAARRVTDSSAALARAVIVDTSTSMQRMTSTGERAIDVATRLGQSLADSATVGIVLRTARPAGAIAGAVAWLGRQMGRGEVAIVSDFQAGAIDSVDLAAIPRNVGVHPVAIRDLRASAAGDVLQVQTAVGSGTVIAHVALAHDRTDVEWTQNPAVPGEERNHLRLLTGPAETFAANATRDAAATIAVPLPLDSNRQIAIVHPNYQDRASLLQRAKPLAAAWMADLVARLGVDSMPVAVADGDQLLLFPRDEPGSLASVILLASVRRALSLAPPMPELDPSTIADSTLTAWQRAPMERNAPGPVADLSDGRWLWAAALVLLALEWLMRRGAEPGGIDEVVRDAAV